jgi:hypothetical protein
LGGCESKRESKRKVKGGRGEGKAKEVREREEAQHEKQRDFRGKRAGTRKE